MADPQQFGTFSIPEQQPPNYSSLESRKLPIQGQLPDPIKKLMMLLGGSDPVAGMIPGEALVPGAIAVLPKNIGIFKTAMDEARANTQITGTGHEMLDQALAWLQTRYPRFASQTVVQGNMEMPLEKLGSSAAAIDPGTNRIVDQWIDINTAHPSGRDLKELIKTMGEEFVHARQYQKYSPETMRMFQDVIPYEYDPFEQAAHRGAETAGKSYEKYLDLLKQQGHPEPPGPSRQYLQALYNALVQLGRIRPRQP